MDSAGPTADTSVRATNQATLIAAAEEGEVMIVESLLRSGADVNEIFEYECGITALLEAARNGHSEVVGQLLRAGADPNIPGERPKSPVAYAIERDSLPSAKLLLEAGATISSSMMRSLVYVEPSPEMFVLLEASGIDTSVFPDDVATCLRAEAEEPPPADAPQSERLEYFIRRAGASSMRAVEPALQHLAAMDRVPTSAVGLLLDLVSGDRVTPQFAGSRSVAADIVSRLGRTPELVAAVPRLIEHVVDDAKDGRDGAARLLAVAGAGEGNASPAIINALIKALGSKRGPRLSTIEALQVLLSDASVESKSRNKAIAKLSRLCGDNEARVKKAAEQALRSIEGASVPAARRPAAWRRVTGPAPAELAQLVSEATAVVHGPSTEGGDEGYAVYSGPKAIDRASVVGSWLAFRGFWCEVDADELVEAWAPPPPIVELLCGGPHKCFRFGEVVPGTFHVCMAPVGREGFTAVAPMLGSDIVGDKAGLIPPWEPPASVVKATARLEDAFETWSGPSVTGGPGRRSMVAAAGATPNAAIHRLLTANGFVSSRRFAGFADRCTEPMDRLDALINEQLDEPVELHFGFVARFEILVAAPHVSGSHVAIHTSATWT